MKKLLLPLFALLIATSCNRLTQFNMEYDQSVVIPSSTGISLPLNLVTPDIESNAESTFEVHDTRKDHIEQIKLTDLSLTITSPAGGTFSFLESCAIYISANGLSEVQIASLNPVPSTAGATITLETTLVDLQEYIKQDQFKMRVNTVTDELLTSDYHIDIHTNFFVDAKIVK
jgi:hypothetical protein